MKFIKNKIFHAAIIVSMVLVSSAIFISQTDRIFGKAAGSGISGTIILYDQGTTSGIRTTSFFSYVYLPSGSCSAYANYCFGDGTTANSKCVSKQISNVSANMFAVDLKPGTVLGSGGSCGTTYTKQQAASFIYSVCSATAWQWGSTSSSVSKPGKTLVSCPVTGSCDNCPAVSVSATDTDAGAPAGTVYTSSCGAFYTKSTAVTEYTGELPQPLGHLDITYNCP